MDERCNRCGATLDRCTGHKWTGELTGDVTVPRELLRQAADTIQHWPYTGGSKDGRIVEEIHRILSHSAGESQK